MFEIIDRVIKIECQLGNDPHLVPDVAPQHVTDHFCMMGDPGNDILVLFPGKTLKYTFASDMSGVTLTMVTVIIIPEKRFLLSVWKKVASSFCSSRAILLCLMVSMVGDN